jgi:hypothetical protein
VKHPARDRQASGSLLQQPWVAFLCLTLSSATVFADAGAGSLDSGAGGSTGGSGTGGHDSGAAGADAGLDAGFFDSGTGGLDAGGSDSGMGDVDAGPPPDAGPGVPTVACSCESDMGFADRHIHLCTGSYDEDVCKTFTCREGTPRSVRCRDRDRVRKCCSMPARGLYTYLYEDCTHPNCETGFLAQCRDFAGSVVDGPCEGSTPPDDDSYGTDEGGCSVSPRVPRAGISALLPALLGLGLLVRRRPRQGKRAS